MILIILSLRGGLAVLQFCKGTGELCLISFFFFVRLRYRSLFPFAHVGSGLGRDATQ